MSDQAKVAVLGAGFLGSCLALELAGRGRRIDLFDRAAMPITGAGLNNEGKLHLGYLWAKDRSRDTAELVASGSLRFAHLLRRWIGDSVDDLPFGRPFHYAMPRESMVPEPALREHVAAIDRMVHRRGEDAERTGVVPADLRRVAPDAGSVWLSRSELDASFDPDRIAAAARTRETAVDPHAVATAVRAAVLRHPGIRFFGNESISAVAKGREGCRVSLGPGRVVGTYRQVVNALWDGRLVIDAGMGIRPPGQWLWRAKASLRISASVSASGVPNATFFVGPFGDISDYGNGSSLLSWYPAGLLGTSTAIAPPDEWSSRDPARLDRIRRDTVTELARLCPAVGRLPAEAIRDADLVGGSIYALGETDIDDPESGLHARTNPGIDSLGGYHSVDPGKYCLVPLMAMRVADRVTGEAAP